ncbi:uncharacterized protein LOC131151089 isoform X2 [Malania oleifera]|uniref:uncharacterized protein LOC131151089 isoform X2 n=1 Tax=Malania oleifera TaxID=397392 RepID=UPI0025AEC6A6|nr:uncharacterized protein LOC131151089 isoform X2 [Malania oleifera]
MAHNFTCLDVSQCMLNKGILHVAAKFFESGISGCLGQFLTLGIKASIWCGKHLKLTLMSTGDSQEEEEHSIFFFQLLLDLLSFSAASFSTLARYPVLKDKILMGTLEKFILEQLNITKDSVSEIKRIDSFGSEVLKVVQLVLDAVIELSKVYSQSINWEICDVRAEKDNSTIKCEQADGRNHIVNIIKCAIEKLFELGIVAANNGGNLVAILNMSWKGVVTLLQLGKGTLAAEVKVSDIILTLISLAKEALKSAAKAWSSSLKEPISSAEAKRTLIPAKFYLINAVRILLLYPCEAFLLYKEMALCVVMISTFSISLTKETFLRNASEAVAEFLEPTSFSLLKSLLNSDQVKGELKFQILDWVFTDEMDLISTHGKPSSYDGMISMDAIFSVGCEAMPRSRVLLLGRVVFFLRLLRSSCELQEDVRFRIARKLEWLLNILIDEEVYCSVLVLQIPIFHDTGKSQELAWQPMFYWLLHTLKSFMIVVSSSLAWGEVLYFLLENAFHPHFLCREIVMELWCFMARYADAHVVNDVVDKLSSLLKLVASSQSVLIPGCAFRKLARSICVLLTCSTQSTIDRFYSSIIGDKRSQTSCLLSVALLMEGFPLTLLTDNRRNKAVEKIIIDYYCFIESSDDESCGSGLFGVPIFALSAASQSLQMSTADIDMKTLKFLVAIIQKYRKSVDHQRKEHYHKLLSETLRIISNTKHLYASDEMEEVILELQKLFISGGAASDTRLHHCKPGLASFMAGLGHMELAETETSLKSSAVWDLYHMLLMERHWALVHLAATAFGYFAARTSCNQLWRFVPQNAALSFDLDGNEAKEERFMFELKAFLEKEKAICTTTPSSEELGLLVKEGLMLKDMVQNINIDLDVTEGMELDGDNQANKRRKLPDGISRGVELLQSGLKVIGDGLSLWQPHHFDSTELHDKFLTQFSRLEEMIDHLINNLAGSGCLNLSGCLDDPWK